MTRHCNFYSLSPNPQMRSKADGGIFRPKLLKKLVLLFYSSLTLSPSILFTIYDYLAFTDIHSWQGFGDFFENVAITLLFYFGTFFLAQRLSIVLVSIDKSSLRFKSFFRELTVPFPEGARFHYRELSGPFFYDFLKVKTAAGNFTLSTFEFSSSQMAEMYSLMLSIQRDSKLGESNETTK